MSTKVSGSLYDLMAVIVALMSGTYFRSSSYLWTQAWKKASETPEGHELLAELDFELLAGGEHYFSAEVEQLARMLLRAEVMEILAPAFRRCLIGESSKQEILSGNEELLVQFGDKLRVLAAILETELRVDE